MSTIDRIDEFADRFDEWMKKATPYFICFAAGFFTAVIYQILARI
jgi:hypothetical protein